MRDGDILVIVEVRAHSAEHGFAGAPEHTVGPEKRARIARATQLYLRTSTWRPRAIRFDVVAVTYAGFGRWDTRWIKRAFEV